LLATLLRRSLWLTSRPTPSPSLRGRDKKITWGYSDFGAPGKIAKREHIADLDIELVTFENGARLN